MKTHKRLFEKICSFDNLLLAAKKAQKGKRYKGTVATFFLRLEENLLLLQRELVAKTYQPGAYRSFLIHDPKERMISAAPFRDRVVHHALCNIIEPVFEQSFIFDSYANRKGKGTHKAIERYQHFAQQYDFVLKCDIRKFFPSIDHEILKQALRRKIGCQGTLWLCDLILDNSNPQEERNEYFPGDDLFTPFERRRGLPIGNLSSQFWANVYMDGFDHFIKEELGVKGYARYVDDFVLFASDKRQLDEWKAALKTRLCALRLLPHPDKTQVHRVAQGVPFLGFRVWRCHRIARKPSVRRYFRRLRRSLRERRLRLLEADKLECRLNAWLGHVRFGQCARLEKRAIGRLRMEEVNVLRSMEGSWRVLEPLFKYQ